MTKGMKISLDEFRSALQSDVIIAENEKLKTELKDVKEKSEGTKNNITLNDIVEVMSDGTDVEIFADLEKVYFGQLANMPKSEYEKYKNRTVYRININKSEKCITVAV